MWDWPLGFQSDIADTRDFVKGIQHYTETSSSPLRASNQKELPIQFRCHRFNLNNKLLFNQPVYHQQSVRREVGTGEYGWE